MIDKDSQVNVKLNPYAVEVLKQIIEHFVDEYGMENFFVMAKEVSTNQRPPKQGIELWITMLGAIIAMFEDQAHKQGFTRQLDEEEMKIFNRKMEEFNQKYKKDNINGN